MKSDTYFHKEFAEHHLQKKVSVRVLRELADNSAL